VDREVRSSVYGRTEGPSTKAAGGRDTISDKNVGLSLQQIRMENGGPSSRYSVGLVRTPTEPDCHRIEILEPGGTSFSRNADVKVKFVPPARAEGPQNGTAAGTPSGPAGAASMCG